MAENTSANDFFIIGNNLSLDFINTEFVENGERKDALSDFASLLSWAVAANLLETKQRTKILHEFGESTAAASEVFLQALNFRAGLRAMVEGLEKGKKVKPQILTRINYLLRAQHGYTEIAQTVEGFVKRFRADFKVPSEILSPVAEAAADLLCYGEVQYLKKCENSECILHFYDTSKNHRRRWCSMKACGNRAKQANFYSRKKMNQ